MSTKIYLTLLFLHPYYNEHVDKQSHCQNKGY